MCGQVCLFLRRPVFPTCVPRAVLSALSPIKRGSTTKHRHGRGNAQVLPVLVRVLVCVCISSCAWIGWCMQKCKGTRDPQRAVRPVVDRALSPKIVVVLLNSLLMCESLSMKFQASRFSASGRRVPLEPRSARRTAYASPCMFSRLERDVVGVFVGLSRCDVPSRTFGVRSASSGHDFC